MGRLAAALLALSLAAISLIGLLVSEINPTSTNPGNQERVSDLGLRFVFGNK
jgi:hypothetical protein